MNVIKYDPFRELRTVQNELNRIFTGSSAPLTFENNGYSKGSWSPNVDIFEHNDHLMVEAELPGLSKEDVDISVENNVLTLKGEKRFEKKVEEDNYLRVERSYGSFTRQFVLPQTITSEGATADYENGVLRISLPKREETKARKIEIGGGSVKAVTANA